MCIIITTTFGCTCTIETSTLKCGQFYRSLPCTPTYSSQSHPGVCLEHLTTTPASGSQEHREHRPTTLASGVQERRERRRALRLAAAHHAAKGGATEPDTEAGQRAAQLRGIFDVWNGWIEPSEGNLERSSAAGLQQGAQGTMATNVNVVAKNGAPGNRNGPPGPVLGNEIGIGNRKGKGKPLSAKSKERLNAIHAKAFIARVNHAVDERMARDPILMRRDGMRSMVARSGKREDPIVID